MKTSEYFEIKYWVKDLLKKAFAKQSIKSGRASFGSLAKTTQANQTITFDTPMEGDYSVVANASNGGAYWASLGIGTKDQTSNGFTLMVYNNGAGTASAFNVDWVAIPNNN